MLIFYHERELLEEQKYLGSNKNYHGTKIFIIFNKKNKYWFQDILFYLKNKVVLKLYKKFYKFVSSHLQPGQFLQLDLGPRPLQPHHRLHVQARPDGHRGVEVGQLEAAKRDAREEGDDVTSLRPLAALLRRKVIKLIFIVFYYLFCVNFVIFSCC